LKEGLFGHADRDEFGDRGSRDGKVTFHELYNYVYARVKESTFGHQHPMRSGTFNPEHVFTRTLSTIPEDDRFGILQVLITEPRDAKVVCNGVAYDLDPRGHAIIRLTPGTYDLRIQRQGYVTKMARMTMETGKIKWISDRLLPVGPSPTFSSPDGQAPVPQFVQP
jgi:hypothetical protein